MERRSQPRPYSPTPYHHCKRRGRGGRSSGQEYGSGNSYPAYLKDYLAFVEEKRRRILSLVDDPYNCDWSEDWEASWQPRLESWFGGSRDTGRHECFSLLPSDTTALHTPSLPSDFLSSSTSSHARNEGSRVLHSHHEDALYTHHEDALYTQGKRDDEYSLDDGAWGHGVRGDKNYHHEGGAWRQGKSNDTYSHNEGGAWRQGKSNDTYSHNEGGVWRQGKSNDTHSHHEATAWRHGIRDHKNIHHDDGAQNQGKRDDEYSHHDDAVWQQGTRVEDDDGTWRPGKRNDEYSQLEDGAWTQGARDEDYNKHEDEVWRHGMSGDKYTYNEEERTWTNKNNTHTNSMRKEDRNDDLRHRVASPQLPQVESISIKVWENLLHGGEASRHIAKLLNLKKENGHFANLLQGKGASSHVAKLSSIEETSDHVAKQGLQSKKQSIEDEVLKKSTEMISKYHLHDSEHVEPVKLVAAERVTSCASGNAMSFTDLISVGQSSSGMGDKISLTDMISVQLGSSKLKEKISLTDLISMELGSPKMKEKISLTDLISVELGSSETREKTSLTDYICGIFK